MAQNPAAPQDPTPTLGNPTREQWLRKQFNWEDVEHRIETGQLLDLVYDYEATDLNTMFAAPIQFSGKIVTLDGRVIDELKLDIQAPEDAPAAPQALLVTKSSAEAIYRPQGRVSPHVAAGKIMLFFRNPYRALWDQLEDQAIKVGGEEVRVYTIASPDGSQHAEIRVHDGGKRLSYRYPDERLPDGALTYRDPDGTRWKKIPAPAITSGHNIRRYDDRLQWSFLHRAMSDEIFLTHTRRYNRFRVDTLALAKLVAQLDQGGENGFKPGLDPKTGLPSFSLSNLMEANTRDAVPERGIDEGVRMPDGSKYDRNLAHADAAYDVDATIALRAYLRKRAPEVVRLVEINSDFEKIKPFLMNGDEGFAPHPLRAFVRDSYPNGPHLHIGACVGINEEIDERRQAVMMRTDIDLAKYKFNGKKLLEMSAEELAAMLKSQRGKPDAVCEIIDLRKNPPVATAEMAFQRGVTGDPEQHEANRRFLIAHDAFCQKLMQAHSLAVPDMPDYKTIRNPQAEEHLFTGIASLKRYEFEVDGKKLLVPESVHKEAEKLLRRNRSIDSALRRALKPQPVEFEERLDSLEAFIERMKTVNKHLQKYLRTDGAVLPPPDKSFTPPKWDYTPEKVPHVVTPEELHALTANAVEYLWKLRAELMYEFHDNTTRYTVQDSHGHDIPWGDIYEMDKKDLAERISSGEYQIKFEELTHSSELMARMFRDAGRIEWAKDYMAERAQQAAARKQDAEMSKQTAETNTQDVRAQKSKNEALQAKAASHQLHMAAHRLGREVKKWEEQERWFDKHTRQYDKEAQQEDINFQTADGKKQAWEKWEEYLAAHRALRWNGAPHEDPDNQRWMTGPKALKEIARIEDNLRKGDLRALDDEWGLGDIFLRNHEGAEQNLDEYKKFIHRQMIENPVTDEKLLLMGYNPSTSLPIEHVPYEIPQGTKILTIDVPDRMIESPLSHHDVASSILMLNPDEAQRKALMEMGEDTCLFLRGAQSGRTYLAAKPALLSSDKIKPSHYFHEVYDAARHRYVDSGTKPPTADQFIPIAVEALAPVPSTIDPAVQTIKIPRWEDFMATVSPTLGYRETPLTGLVIKHEGDEALPGRPVRLQGMIGDDHKPGQTESGWEVAATITDVQTMTLLSAKERIAAGLKQMKIAGALHFDSVEAMRAALANNSLTDDDIEKAGVKKLHSRNDLQQLLQEASFTPSDALHYGYVSLTDMRTKLTNLFVDKELNANRDDNLIHFVDLDPAKKKMIWHHPTKRAMVRLADDVAAQFEAATQEPGPDASNVHGAPDIERGLSAGGLERN